MDDIALREIDSILERLRVETNATLIFAVRMTGHLLGFSGDASALDTTKLAQLSVAALNGPGWLDGGDLVEAATGSVDHRVHAFRIGDRGALVVIVARSESLGLVHLRGRKAATKLDAFVGGDGTDDGGGFPPPSGGEGGSGAPAMVGIERRKAIA